MKIGISEFHRRYKFNSRGKLLSKTVSLRIDYYQKLLKIRSFLQFQIDTLDQLTLSETLAYIIDIAYSELIEKSLREKYRGEKE